LEQENKMKPVFKSLKLPYMKWYHWFLYPFAKKFCCGEDGCVIKGFRIFGVVYVIKHEVEKMNLLENVCMFGVALSISIMGVSLLFLGVVKVVEWWR